MQEIKKSKYFWPIFFVTFPLMIPIYIGILLLVLPVFIAWILVQLTGRL